MCKKNCVAWAAKLDNYHSILNCYYCMFVHSPQICIKYKTVQVATILATSTSNPFHGWYRTHNYFKEARYHPSNAPNTMQPLTYSHIFYVTCPTRLNVITVTTTKPFWWYINLATFQLDIKFYITTTAWTLTVYCMSDTLHFCENYQCT